MLGEPGHLAVAGVKYRRQEHQHRAQDVHAQAPVQGQHDAAGDAGDQGENGDHVGDDVELDKELGEAHGHIVHHMGVDGVVDVFTFSGVQHVLPGGGQIFLGGLSRVGHILLGGVGGVGHILLGGVGGGGHVILGRLGLGDHVLPGRLEVFLDACIHISRSPGSNSLKTRHIIAHHFYIFNRQNGHTYQGFPGIRQHYERRRAKRITS